MCSSDLSTFRADLEALLNHARNVIDGPETEEMNTTGANIERHHHNSNEESIDLEPALEKGGAAAGAPDIETDAPGADVEEASQCRHQARGNHLLFVSTITVFDNQYLQDR